MNSAWEIEYIEKSIKHKLELTKNYFVEGKDNNLNYYIWGYKQPEEMKSSGGKQVITQLFITTVINKEYIVGLNAIVPEGDDPNNILKDLIIVGSTITGYNNPVDQNTIQSVYNKYYDKF